MRAVDVLPQPRGPVGRGCASEYFTLLGVLAQRLARRVCGACSVKEEAAAEELEALALEYCADSSLHPADVLAHWQSQANGPILLARALDGLRPQVASPIEMWQRLTDQYVVDLDAVAALLPADEPETHWLPARD